MVRGYQDGRLVNIPDSSPLDVWKNYTRVDPGDRRLEKETLHHLIDPIVHILDEYKTLHETTVADVDRVLNQVKRDMNNYSDFRENAYHYNERLKQLADAIRNNFETRISLIRDAQYITRPPPHNMTVVPLHTKGLIIPDPHRTQSREWDGPYLEFSQEQIDTIRRAADSRDVNELHKLIEHNDKMMVTAQHHWYTRLFHFQRLLLDIQPLLSSSPTAHDRIYQDLSTLQKAI